MKKTLSHFSGILPFLAAMLIQVIVTNGMAIGYGFIYGFKLFFENAAGGTVEPSDMEHLISEGLNSGLLYLFSVLAVLICGIIFAFWYRWEIRGEVKVNIRSILSFRWIVILLALGLAIQLFFTGAMSLLQPLLTDIFSSYAKQMEYLFSGHEIVVILMVIFIAPISEELIFRGVILHMAGRTLPFVLANLLQALLFGVYHWNLVQGVYAFFIGLILGFIYRRFGHIFVPMLLHMIINSSAFLAAYLPKYNFVYIVSLAAGALIIFILLGRMRATMPSGEQNS